MACDEMPSESVADSERAFAVDLLAGGQVSEVGFGEGFGTEFEMAKRPIDFDDRQAATREGDAVAESDRFAVGTGKFAEIEDHAFARSDRDRGRQDRFGFNESGEHASGAFKRTYGAPKGSGSSEFGNSVGLFFLVVIRLVGSQGD